MKLVFRKSNGGLYSLVHSPSQVDLRAKRDEAPAITWVVKLETAEAKELYIPSNQAQFRGHSVATLEDGYKLVLTWDNLKMADVSYPAKVQASLTVRHGDPLTHWRIEIENKGSAAITEVQFPMVTGVEALGNDSNDDVFLVPRQMGTAFRDPVRNLRGWKATYPSSFMAMQFLAYFDERSGFYFAAHDSDGYAKAFEWAAVPSGANISISHLAPVQFGASFALPYDVVLSTFIGDWAVATDLYKGWALDQSWARRALAEKKTPPWVLATAVAADYSIDLGGAEDPRWKQKEEVARAFKLNVANAQRHRDYFSRPSLFGIYGWERGGMWSSGDYFPALGDWAKFDDLMASLHSLGARVWLYVDGNALTVSSTPWATGEAEPFALRDKGRKPVVQQETGFPEPHALMNPATSYWQGKLKEYTVTLARHGVDMIQIDGFPQRPPIASYDTSHGRPAGLGGNWYAQGWLSLLDELRRAVREANPEVALSTEGVAEIYLPYVDVFDSRDTWQTEALEPQGTQVPVPLFRYVYGQRAHMVSHQSLGIRNSSGGGSFDRLGFGRALAWGGIPSYRGLHLHESALLDTVTLEYVRRTVQARDTHLRPFVVGGEMLRPLRLESPTTSVVSKLAGITTPLEVPAIQHSAWRSADGSLAFVFTNISETPVSIALPSDLERYGVARDERYQATIWMDGKQQRVAWPPSQGLDVLVSPLQVVAVIIAAES